MNGIAYLRIVGVHSDLILGSIAKQTLRVGEADIGRCGAVTLCREREWSGRKLRVMNNMAATYGH
jgi:hypothetical protein